MLWPMTGLPWVATSPNIPTIERALSYPGIGLVGETLVNEGRGTTSPFTQFGAPWLAAEKVAESLNAHQLPGARFEATTYIPLSIANVAANPRFAGERVRAVRITITDIAHYQPVEVGVHALAKLQKQAVAHSVNLFGSLGMLNSVSGTTRLHQMLTRHASGGEIAASWSGENAAFRALRQRYLLY